MTARWSKNGRVPSGWGHVKAPGPLEKTMGYFYKKMQAMGTEFHQDGTKHQRALQADGHRFIKEAAERVKKKRAEEVAAQ